MLEPALETQSGVGAAQILNAEPDQPPWRLAERGLQTKCAVVDLRWQ